MSYILDALKKVDQEREFGAVPGLATPHEVDHPRPRPFRWRWVIAALLSVNVVLLALLLVKRDAEAPGMAPATPEWQQAGADDPLVQPGRQARKGETAQAPTPGGTALPKNKQPFSVGELAASPKPVNSPNTEPPLQPEGTVEMRTETVAPANGTSQLQSWYELPQEFRMRLSLPRLDLHVYSEDPQNRFILVNLKKFREGETLESGLLLEEIVPEGMVMRYRGERFMVEK
jgi:general secretion pathway protein B